MYQGIIILHLSFIFYHISNTIYFNNLFWNIRYSVIVASSFLQLILQERTVILERTKKKVKKELATAIDALKKIPSKTALQELDDMLTGGNGMEWGGGSNTIDTVSRAEALQKTKSTLKEIEENMLEKYLFI